MSRYRPSASYRGPGDWVDVRTSGVWSLDTVQRGFGSDLTLKKHEKGRKGRQGEAPNHVSSVDHHRDRTGGILLPSGIQSSSPQAPS